MEVGNEWKGYETLWNMYNCIVVSINNYILERDTTCVYWNTQVTMLKKHHSNISEARRNVAPCCAIYRRLSPQKSLNKNHFLEEIGVSHHFEFWLTPPGVLEHPGACTGPVGGGITNRVQCNVFFPESAMRDVESVQQLIHCEVDRAAFNEKEKILPLQNQDWTATRVENEPRQWVGSVWKVRKLM